MKGMLLAVAGAAVLTLVATIVFRLFAVRRRAAVRVRVFLLSLFFVGLLQIYNLAERGFSLRILSSTSPIWSTGASSSRPAACERSRSTSRCGLFGRWARYERRAAHRGSAGLVAQIVVCRGLDLDTHRILCGAVLIFCAFILYMPFYYVLATSFSVRMLLEIRRARPPLSPGGLRALYPGAVVLGDRLATLSASGYALKVGEFYVLTSKGRLVARVFGAVKSLWRPGPRRLDAPRPLRPRKLTRPARAC
jgi:hypothetical protein